MRRTKLAGLAWGGAATAVALAVACSGSDRSFDDGPQAQAGSAGAAGADEGSSSAGNAGGVGQGGQPDVAAGASPIGVGGDAGGAPPVAPTPDCPDGYSDWLTSSFAFPDGDVIGTADFPSFPWIPTGALEIKAGRVQGAGSAITGQASVFPYTGTRLRFRARFTDSKQTVVVAANTAADGAGGLRVTLDAAGELILGEGMAVRGQASLEPLESGVDWFVEAVFKGAEAVVSVSGKNYPGGAGSEPKAELNASGLKGTAAGVKASVRLDSEVGVSPALDDLSIARCGAAAPEYDPKLIDTFERANSTSLGNAEFPTNAAWTSAAASGIAIVDGALQTAGNLKAASLPLEVPLAGLRIRTTLSAVEGASGSFLWADVNFNVAKGVFGIAEQGFWVWGGSTDPTFHTGLFVGGSEVAHGTRIAAATKYFAEMNRDDTVAVITVRSQSFEGPILGIQYAGKLTTTSHPGAYLNLADEGGPGTRFEDIRVDNYPSQ